MQKRSRLPFLLVFLSALLLIGEFGAVMHGYTHLPQQLQVAQQSAEKGSSRHHTAADKADFCDICLAFAAFGAGLLSHQTDLPISVFIAVVAGFCLTSFTARLCLAFRSRAPPVFS